MASQGFIRQLGAFVFGCGVSSVSLSCNIAKGFTDFGNDLTNQEMVVIDGPGTKIADGQLSGMHVEPSDLNGKPIIVGFRYLEDGPQLRTQPFDGSPGCAIGRAESYILFKRLENEPQLIGYLDGIANRRGTLNFADHACNVVYGGLPDTELPMRLFESPPGFIVASGTKLLEVDPFRKKTRVLTENLQIWNGTGDTNNPAPVIWYVADGQLVVLDESRQKALSLGTAVSQVVFIAGDISRGLFLVDGGELHWYQQVTGTAPKVLAKDVCGASVESFGISYFSPCSELRLVVQDPEKGTTYPVDSQLLGKIFVQARPKPDGSGMDIEAAYTKASTDEGYVDLWLKQAGQVPRIWRKHIVSYLSGSLDPSANFVAVVDADSTGGNLVRSTAEGETILCSRVALEYPVTPISNGWLLLTEVTDGFGNLVWVGQSGERQIVLEHISVADAPLVPQADPNFTGIKDPGFFNLRALLTNRIGDAGALTRGTVGPLDGPPGVRGPHVMPGKFAFFSNMDAIGYIDDFDGESGTGSLSVYQTHVGATSLVSTDVSEFDEMTWPYEGVLYSVKKGDAFSIWAARAKP